MSESIKILFFLLFCLILILIGYYIESFDTLNCELECVVAADDHMVYAEQINDNMCRCYYATLGNYNLVKIIKVIEHE